MEKATSRSVAFSSFKITANFNIVTRCLVKWIKKIQISSWQVAENMAKEKA